MTERLFYILLIISLLSCQNEQVDINALIHTQHIQAPLQLNAGSPLLPYPATSHSHSQQYLLSGINGTIELDYDAKSESIILPKPINEKAGVYTLTIIRDQRITHIRTLEIKAKAAQGKALSYIGPKSVPYNDQNGVMVTSALTDQYNNMLKGQYGINYHQLSDNTYQINRQSINHEYYTSKTLYVSNDKVALVGIEADDSYSDELFFEGSSGCPVSAEIYVEEYYNVADGTQTFQVHLSEILDADDAPVETGTYMRAALYDAEQKLSANYQFICINGTAQITMVNPNQQGDYQVKVSACGDELAASAELSFEADFLEIPKQWISSHLLKVGPIVSRLNQKLQDGTPVLLQFIGCQADETIYYKLDDGICLINTDEIIANCKTTKLSVQIRSIKDTISNPNE